MLIPRVIPVLLLSGRGLVKTLRFEDPRYIGDPINTVRIFNKKEVDEIVLLDISAVPQGRGPDLEIIGNVSSESFMPFTCGGGIRSLDEIRAVLSTGAEKVVINTAAEDEPGLIDRAAKSFGSQSIVVSIDVKGGVVFTSGGRKATGRDPVEWAIEVESRGAGEILLTSIDRDGTRDGYDIDLVKAVSSAVGIPVVACGGAGSVEDLRDVVKEGGASAAAAGSLFVFCGSRDAVLITYPDRKVLDDMFR